MEAGEASSSRSSQSPPSPMDESPASEPCGGDLSAVMDGEGASSIRERVVTGIKALNRERDLLSKLRADVKKLRKQRDGMYSSKRSSMDEEIGKAKLRVEHQAEVVAALEGQGGPFKEKFLNERRFGRMVKVEDEEILVSDRLPPQGEANNSTPSEGHGGGLLQAIQVAESPARMDRMIFSVDDITEDMPDKVKAGKIIIHEKSVFVPFGSTVAGKALSFVGDHPVPSKTEIEPSAVNVHDFSVGELQVSSAPIGQECVPPPVAACPAPGMDRSMLQQQDTNGTASGELQIPSAPIGQECVSHPVAACPAPGMDSSVLQHQGFGVAAPGEGRSKQKDTVDTGTAGGKNAAVTEGDSVIAAVPPKAVSGPASPAVGTESIWSMGKGAPTFAHVLSSDPGSVIRPGQQTQRGSASRQTIPPLATTSRAPRPGWAPLQAPGQRRNVVLLKWEGGGGSPARRRVVDLILGMGFGASDLYALIHVDGTRDYTISFTRPEGLDLFWERFEARCRSSPDWEGLVPVAVSIQSTIKKVTIILTNESVPARDLEVWLRHYGDLITCPVKILDDRDIWTGGWSVTIRLARDGNVVRHLPSSAFIGRDRMTIFYPGQPKLCHRCGEKGHFSSGCSALICTMCRGRGHVAKDCTEIRCNLCHCLGHPYSQCPEAWHNIERDITEEFERLKHIDFLLSEPPSPVADPPGPVQGPVQGPVRGPGQGPVQGPVRGPVQVPVVAPATTLSVSVSQPLVSVAESPQSSVSVPSVSAPSVSQKSVFPPVTSPRGSGPSKGLGDPLSSQGKEEVCVVGTTSSSNRRAPAKSRAKAKNKERDVSLSEDDLRYLEERRGVRRKGKQKAQVVQVEEDPIPVSNRFSILSGSSISSASSGEGEESDMECGAASRKREASSDEQQRGAKKPSV